MMTTIGESTQFPDITGPQPVPPRGSPAESQSSNSERVSKSQHPAESRTLSRHLLAKSTAVIALCAASAGAVYFGKAVPAEHDGAKARTAERAAYAARFSQALALSGSITGKMVTVYYQPSGTLAAREAAPGQHCFTFAAMNTDSSLTAAEDRARSPGLQPQLQKVGTEYTNPATGYNMVVPKIEPFAPIHTVTDLTKFLDQAAAQGITCNTQPPAVHY